MTMTVAEEREDRYRRMAAGEQIRMTAMFLLQVLDYRTLRVIEERAFIGTDQEAADELEAEYNEHHPRRDDSVWRRAYAAIHYTSDRRCRVTAPADAMGPARAYQIERTGPFKEEKTNVE